jgi:type II secretory pathway component GspD/PulD (secretin)
MHQLFANKTATLPQAEVDAARIELEKGILALLDNDQRVKWEGMTGRVVDLAQAGPATGAGPPGGPPSRGGFSREGGREGFSREGGRDGMSRSGTPAAGSTNASVGLKAENGEVKLKFQFRYTPWKEVIDWFAQQSDYSLVTDNYPTGTFNYSDSRAYTPAEALDLLNSVLLTKDYRLVRKERALFLAHKDDVVPDSFAPRILEADLDKRGEFEIVQCMFQLNKITAEDAEAEIRKLVAPYGKVIVLSKARQLVVTEYVGTLKQIRTAIQAIENPAVPKDETTVVVRLETLRPSEFMAQARTSLNIPENQFATADGSLRISVDELGMRLLVTGKPERIEKVEEIRKLIDSDSGSLTDGNATPLEQPQLVIYSVQKADPAAVLQVLQVLLAGQPDTRLTIEPKSGNLVALCRPSQHATIRATLDEMQRDATQVEVIKLRRIDPQAAVLQINKLFGGGDQPAPNAPKVEADTTNMQLLIRANAPQVAQIRELLQKMGEVGEDSPLTQAERTTMRMIPLTGSSARKAVEQLESLWPVVHKNKIRVVTPANRTPRGSGQFDQPPTEGPNSSDALEQLERETEKYRPSSSRAVPAPAGQVPVSDRTTKAPARGQTQAYFVSQPLPAVETNQPEAAQPQAAPATTTQPDDTAAEKPAEEAPAGPVSKPGAEVVITVTPNGIFIVSEDLDALDKMEEMLRQVADNQVSGSKELAIYYLKYAKAQVAATLLQEMLSGAPAPSDGGGGSLMGDIAANMMGDMGGGGLLGGVLGMGGGGSSGAVVSAGSATITPDIRLNSLMVQATSRDHERIEEILQFIDKPAGPEAVQTAAAPRFIPVYNSTADSIATVVRQVYAGRMAADASGGGQQRQPSPEDFIRALRGGRGGRGGNDQAARGEETKMTVGVDTRTNSLIVSAPDYLFEEVKALVAQLDTAELASDETVRVVSLRAANADVITRSLAQVYGDSITSSKTSTSDTGSSSRSSTSRSSSNSSRSSSNSSRGSSSSQGRSPQASGGDFRQQMQMIQALQGGGGGGGRGGFGGGGSRGGFGGGGFGGGRGGR